ncbi:MAG: dihydrolipoyl dehydrogenase [bacterium]|nr:dihydrolipoyl dehydrogenase [bacterium]
MKHDLLVIGAGPGGYVAALRAAELGMNVACVERESALGGTCLRIGCVPSKALLQSSHIFEQTLSGLGEHGISAAAVECDLEVLMARKGKVVAELTGGIASLFKRARVTRYEGTASFAAAGVIRIEGEVTCEVEADKVLIATGSQTATLPGVELDHDRIATSTEALSWREAPEHLVVIGAGVIGLELGTVWRRLGSRVTVLEYMDTILPGMDGDIVREMQRLLKRQGLTIKLGARVTAAGLVEGMPVVEVEGEDPIKCDRVLLATGRVPYTTGLNLEAIGLATDERGRLTVDDNYETAVAGVFAIGDVIDGPMLAHRAEEEAVACTLKMAGKPGHVNYDVIPGVVYTEPEVAAVGKTEEALKAEAIPYKKGQVFMRANSRAKAGGHIDGRVKILAHAESGLILGAHITGANASELIAEVALAMEHDLTCAQLCATCHAHPTLSEAVRDAARATTI